MFVKNLSIKILFLLLFAGCINAQIMFEPPKEWANSVSQSAIDASPTPILSGKPLRIGSCKKNEFCTEALDYAPALDVYVENSPNFTKDNWISETADFSAKREEDVEHTIRFLIRSHQWQKALEASNKAIPKWYSSPIAYVNRAIIFYAIGQNDRALKDLEAALYWSNGKNDSAAFVLAHLQRGIIYAKRGDIEKAKADYDIYAAIPSYYWTNKSLASGKNALLASIDSGGSSSDNARLAQADTYLDDYTAHSNCNRFDAKVLEFSVQKNHRVYQSLLYLSQGAFACKDLPKAYEYAQKFIEFTRAEQKKEDTVRNRNAVRIAYQVRREMYESERKFVETVYDALEAYKMVSNRFDSNLLLTDEEYSYAEVVVNQLAKVPNNVQFTLEEMSNFLALRSSVIATQRKNAAANDAQVAKLANKDQSSFRLCNKYGESLKVAVSYPDKDFLGLFSDGWAWLKNGECTGYVTVDISHIERYGKPKYAAFSNEINPTSLAMPGFACLPKINGMFSRGHLQIPLSCDGEYASYPADTIDIQANKMLTVNLEKK